VASPARIANSTALRLSTGSAPGCPVLTDQARCPAHTRQIDRRRGTAYQRGYTSRWADFARRYRRQYPLCGMRAPGAPETTDSVCQRDGIVTAAALVDHIVPVTGKDDPSFWTGPFQSLCSSCHNQKRQKESMRGRG